MTNQDAYLLRENTGTSGVVETARAAVAVLADHDIPHLIVGGIAVQEHGYPRVTIDVDILVPDVLEAVEWLTASLTKPFIVKLEELISLKLDSWSGSPLRRHKDKTDVIELITRRKLPRDLAVHPVVRPLYEETWDALQAEK